MAAAEPRSRHGISGKLAVGRRRDRSMISLMVLVVAMLSIDFAPPMLQRAALWRAAELRPGVPRSAAAEVTKAATYAFEAVGLVFMLRAVLRSLNLPESIRKQDASNWDGRRFWTLLNVGNHAIYALLFIVRSFFYTGVGGGDRPFYFESYFLGYLCGPSCFLPRLLGWEGGMYNQPFVLKWMTAVNAGTSSAGGFPNWIQVFIANPSFMFWYQIAEGTFHLMIVFGGLRALFGSFWPPKKEGDASQTLFRWGLWLEIVLMDITYVSAYSCLPFLACPGHWGLTTIMMLIHHLNVLPDIMCAWHEWKADKEAAASPKPALSAA